MDCKPEEAILLLRGLLPGILFIAASRETHQDGEPHLHAYVELERKVDIRDPRRLDINGAHGNYRSARDTRATILAYLSKESNPVIEKVGDENQPDDGEDRVIKKRRSQAQLIIQNGALHCATQGLLPLSLFNIAKNLCAEH